LINSFDRKLINFQLLLDEPIRFRFRTDWPIGNAQEVKRNLKSYELINLRKWIHAIFYQHFHCIDSNTSLLANNFWLIMSFSPFPDVLTIECAKVFLLIYIYNRIMQHSHIFFISWGCINSRVISLDINYISQHAVTWNFYLKRLGVLFLAKIFFTPMSINPKFVDFSNKYSFNSNLSYNPSYNWLFLPNKKIKVIYHEFEYCYLLSKISITTKYRHKRFAIFYP
jgi:hypothetical protein